MLFFPDELWRCHVITHLSPCEKRTLRLVCRELERLVAMPIWVPLEDLKNYLQEKPQANIRGLYNRYCRTPAIFPTNIAYREISLKCRCFNDTPSIPSFVERVTMTFAYNFEILELLEKNKDIDIQFHEPWSKHDLFSYAVWHRNEELFEYLYENRRADFYFALNKTYGTYGQTLLSRARQYNITEILNILLRESLPDLEYHES